jgi:hypothetical protein
MISIPTTIACRNCGGLGLCVECNGTGRTQCVQCDDGWVAHDTWSYCDEPFQSVELCDDCGGSGVQACADCCGSGLCDACNGSGEEVT